MEELISNLSKELDFNNHNVSEVLAKLPKLYSGCLNKWYQLAKELDSLEIQLNNRRNERYTYYKLDFEIDLSTAEIKTFLDGDNDLNEIRSKILVIKRKVDIIEKMMGMINDTRWSIKSFIDWEKFKNGVI